MQRSPSHSAISTLIVEVLGSETHPLAPEMAGWMNGSKRFRLFADTYRDKIRKKVRDVRDREGLRDVRCELAVAYLLLREHHFALHYELQNPSKQRAPDFTAVYRNNLPFCVEVTRMHGGTHGKPPASRGEDTRLANTLCAKLGQMQRGAVNVLVLWSDGLRYEAACIAATARALLMRASSKDEAYFAWHGFGDARDFLHQYQRLSGVLLIANRQGGASRYVSIWENNQARHPIPVPIRTLLGRMGELPAQTETL